MGPVVVSRLPFAAGQPVAAANDADLYDNFDSQQNADAIQQTITRIATAQAGKRPPTGQQGPVIPTTAAGARLATGQRPATGQFVVNNAGPRPMTAVKGAGYTSSQATAATAFTSTVGLANTGIAPPLAQLIDTPQGLATSLENEVHRELEASSINASAGKVSQALDHAKAAGLKERTLVKHRDKHQYDQNLDLTYAVLFNLAVQMTTAKHYQDALHVYQTILNRKVFPVARVKVNMGYIYYIQKVSMQAPLPLRCLCDV